MTPAELEAAAKALWNANASRASCPAWEELGSITQEVWRERARRVHAQPTMFTVELCRATDYSDLDKCPYCGMRTEEPCDEPPAVYCERAIDAMLS